MISVVSFAPSSSNGCRKRIAPGLDQDAGALGQTSLAAVSSRLLKMASQCMCWAYAVMSDSAMRIGNLAGEIDMVGMITDSSSPRKI